MFAFYKHIAPPERGIVCVRVLQTYRSSGARDRGVRILLRSPLLDKGKTILTRAFGRLGMYELKLEDSGL
jgi:hypothetical protein